MKWICIILWLWSNLRPSCCCLWHSEELLPAVHIILALRQFTRLQVETVIFLFWWSVLDVYLNVLTLSNPSQKWSVRSYPAFMHHFRVSKTFPFHQPSNWEGKWQHRAWARSICECAWPLTITYTLLAPHLFFYFFQKE